MKLYVRSNGVKAVKKAGRRVGRKVGRKCKEKYYNGLKPKKRAGPGFKTIRPLALIRISK